MKIVTKKSTYEKVMAMKRTKPRRPLRPLFLLQGLVRLLAIFDMMQAVSCPIHTVCLGKAHGMAALLLAAGEKGERKMYANGEIMLTQVSRDRTFGQASDIELETEHLLNVKERVADLLVQLTGIPKAKIQADLERKHWLFADQALDYGIVDKVI